MARAFRCGWRAVVGRLALIPAGDERQAIYRFMLHDEQGRILVEGRATVVLNSPLPRP